jgi:hypothetical protein
MGAAVRAGGMSTLTDTLVTAAPPLHGLVVKGPMLLASRRQHCLRFCALHTLRLVLSSPSCLLGCFARLSFYVENGPRAVAR